MSYTGYSIEEIEDAIIATLKGDATLHNYVKTFDRLPWERADEAEKLVKLYPALLVAYTGGSDESKVTNTVDHTGKFSVWCSARNLRSPSAAATGPVAGEKGVYDLLHDVLGCLHFSNLGLDIFWCRSLRVRPLAASPRITIFAREFEVRWRLHA